MTLLFILLHPNADATMRLEGFSLLLWPELYPVSQTSNDRCKPQTKNVSASCTCFCDFVDGYKRYSSYVNILKPWPNGVASTRKLKTWFYLRLRLARACVHLRRLAMICALLKYLHASQSKFFTTWSLNPSQRKLSDVC